MAQSGYTPISLYYSSTTTNVPLAANLANGELAINITDGKLFYKDNAGVVQTIASKSGNVNVSSISFGTTGLTPNTATTGAVTVAGTLAVANGGTGLTTLTANNVILGNGTSAPSFVAPGTSGNVLTSNGTTWASTAPAAQVYPGAGIAVSTGSAWTTSKTSPTGDIVGTTDGQTLTNKTFTGYTETVYALSGTSIDAANGTIQTKTLGGSTTFTEALSDGQSVVLMLNPSTYSVTWPTMTWINVAGSGSAPTLKASATNVVIMWQVGGTVYGNWIGSN